MWVQDRGLESSVSPGRSDGEVKDGNEAGGGQERKGKAPGGDEGDQV